MSTLIPPHGGDELKPLIHLQAERPDESKRAEGLKKIDMFVCHNLIILGRMLIHS